MADVPRAFVTAIKNFVFPPDSPLDASEWEPVETDGFTLKLRRLGDQVEVLVPGRDAEHQLRAWFGHDDPDEEASMVRGFRVVREYDEDGNVLDRDDDAEPAEVQMKIERPTLIVETIDQTEIGGQMPATE